MDERTLYLRERIAKALLDKSMIHSVYKTSWKDLVYKDKWRILADTVIKVCQEANIAFVLRDTIILRADNPYPMETTWHEIVDKVQYDQCRFLSDNGWVKIKEIV